MEPYEFDDDNSTYKSFYGYTYKFINEEEYDKCGPYNNVSLIAYLTGYDEDYMLIFENCAFLEEHHEEYAQLHQLHRPYPRSIRRADTRHPAVIRRGATAAGTEYRHRA